MQTRLLREDYFSPLLEGIDDLKRGRLDPRDMKIYTNIRVIKAIFDPKSFEGIQYLITFDKPANWEKLVKRNCLMAGNQICLSLSPTFSDPCLYFATLLKTEKDLLKQGYVLIKLNHSDQISFNDRKRGVKQPNMTMVESPAYWPAYEPVLKRLRKMRNNPIPFASCLVNMSKEAFVEKADWVLSLEGGELTLLQQLVEKFDKKYSFDAKQREAFIAGISNKLSLIQGPPGTGQFSFIFLFISN